MTKSKVKNSVNNILLKNKYSLVLIVAILLCLWPLSFFVYIPKWDNINGYLPYRYFISDYLWNGHLPLWNPFQRLGYPGYSDLQSGVWSPIMWVIVLFGKYTINSLIVELLSCYVLAGLGMFKLANYFFNCKKTSLILGLSYALSGFMVGSAQLMVFLIAVTWFPWCIYALLQFFKTYRLKYQLLSALFMALFITGASPAYTIILGYIVVGIFIYQIVIQRKDVVNIKKILIGGMLILIALVILIAPYIVSFLEFIPYFNRGDKLEYSGFLLSNPFTPVSYISFLFPHAVIAKSDWFNITDLSLRNGYFGILLLIGAVAALGSRITRLKMILIVCVIMSLILAAGDKTFVFELLYNLPGFGIFRHPSVFRAFTIFCCILLAGGELKQVINNGVEQRHKIAFSGVIGLFFVAGLWAFTKTSFSEVKMLIVNAFDFVEFSESALSTHLLLNTIITISLVGLLIVSKRVFKLSWFLSMIIFIGLDLGIQTQLTIPTTVCYNFKQNDLTQFFKEIPNEINQKDNYTALKELNEKQPLVKTNGIWQNVSTFNKTLSCVGVNPMRFKSFDQAKENGNLAQSLERNIIYFIDSNLVLDDIFVGYNKFSAKINKPSNQNQKLVLNQNYHDLWNVTLNGEKIPIAKHNQLTMEVVIPKNTSGIIEFEYRSSKIIYAIIISIMGYFLFLSLIFSLKLKK
ncbi:MAG: hypothetical protein COB15_02430 [Flavobacteriales bacterium]|nr:MAG: hypothetical protein COB15_02430 [Flavobacteriales bacterium]